MVFVWSFNGFRNMKQNCSLYFRPDGCYILSLDFTVARFWVCNGFAVFVPKANPVELTSAIKMGLTHSTQGVAVPSSPVDVPEIVRRNKIKTWRSPEKDSKLLGVQVAGDQIIMTINKSYKGGGFVFERDETYPIAMLEEIGNKLSKLSGWIVEGDDIP